MALQLAPIRDVLITAGPLSYMHNTLRRPDTKIIMNTLDDYSFGIFGAQFATGLVLNGTPNNC